jgi:hypothetical protein
MPKNPAAKHHGSSAPERSESEFPPPICKCSGEWMVVIARNGYCGHCLVAAYRRINSAARLSESSQRSFLACSNPQATRVYPWTTPGLEPARRQAIVTLMESGEARDVSSHACLPVIA